MKKIIFCAAMLFSCLTYKAADAQIRVNLGFNIHTPNIRSQPEWGPVGYAHAEYYYMPDVDAYYDVPNHQYVYNENNVWIHAAALPPRYHYDPYHSYKVVVNQRNPWEHNADVRARYGRYKGHRSQQVIRDSHDAKYRDHYHEDHGRPGDHDNGHH